MADSFDQIGALYDSAPQFLVGTDYEGWTVEGVIFDRLTEKVIAAVADAPESITTGSPFVMVVRTEDGEVHDYRDSDKMLLAIKVAHSWATTDVLDIFDEVHIAQLLTITSFAKTPVEALAPTLSVLHQAALKMANGEEL